MVGSVPLVTSRVENERLAVGQTMFEDVFVVSVYLDVEPLSNFQFLWPFCSSFPAREHCVMLNGDDSFSKLYT